MAIIAKPGEPIVGCIQVSPDVVGSNRIIANIKDSAGNTVDSKDATRLGDSMLYCADFTAPSTEGKYYIDFKIVDAQGNIVQELPDELVIVSSTSIEAKLDEIIATLQNNVQPKLDTIESKIDEVLTWVKIRKC